MPQFVCLLPAAPIIPVATPAVPGSAAPDTLQPSDLTSPNFLVQFKSALKNLANVVALPQIVSPRTPLAQIGGPLLSDPAAAAPVAPERDKAVDPNMPALLAELGFAMVPTTFGTPPAGGGATIAASVVAPRAASLTPAARAEQALPPAQSHTLLPAVVGALDHLTPTDQAYPSLQPAVQSQPQLQPGPPTEAAAGVTPQPELAVAPEVLASVMQQPAGASSVAIAPAAPPSTIDSSPPVGPHHVPQGGSEHRQSDSQSGGGYNQGARDMPAEIAPVSSEPAIVLQTTPVSDAAMIAAAATTGPAGPQLTLVGPSAVVSQIARHADLIRLPGNRGLHIQLHPDDLGGVQVTVHYSPAGGVELHINAEHAATGALVQAGWSELRDSLATQGISPERLVLSVTSSGAGQTDLAGRGGPPNDPSSYSSGQSGQAGLDGQNDPGQSRREPSPQRASPNWSSPLDPIASPDGTPHVASATRIDYRA